MSNQPEITRYEARQTDQSQPQVRTPYTWEVIDKRWQNVVLYDVTAEHAQSVAYLMNSAWEQGMRDAVATLQDSLTDSLQKIREHSQSRDRSLSEVSPETPEDRPKLTLNEIELLVLLNRCPLGLWARRSEQKKAIERMSKLAPPLVCDWVTHPADEAWFTRITEEGKKFLEDKK